MTFASGCRQAGRRSLKLSAGGLRVRHSAWARTHDGLALLPGSACSNHRCRPLPCTVFISATIWASLWYGSSPLGEMRLASSLSSVCAASSCARTWRGRTASRGCRAHQSSATATVVVEQLAGGGISRVFASSFGAGVAFLDAQLFQRHRPGPGTSPSESQRRWFSWVSCLHVLRCRPPAPVSSTCRRRSSAERWTASWPRCPVP